MTLQFNIFAVLLIVAAVATGVLAILLMKRGGSAGRNFALMMAALSIWAGAYAFELTSVTLEAMLFWIRIEYLGIGLIPAFWITFCLAYVGLENRLTPVNTAAIFLIPVLTIFFVWTNDWHGLHYASVAVDDSGPFPMFNFSRGMWYWVHLYYFYILLIIGFYLLIRNYRQAAPIFRKQTLVVLFGALIPWFANLLYHIGFRPIEYLDITPFVFTATGLIIGLGLLEFKLFSIVPIARDKVVEDLEDGVMVLDAFDRIVYLNPAMRLYTEGFQVQPEGRLFNSVFDQYPILIQLVESRVNGKASFELDTGGNDSIVLDVSATSLQSRQDSYNGLLLVFRDITEQRKNEQELIQAKLRAEESDRLKTAFLANMSHEIRNPMNGIIGFAGILKDDDLTEEDRNRYLDIIEKNAEQLLLIINDIIDISKIESGQEHIKPAKIQIKDLFRDLRDAFMPQALKKKLKLTFTTSLSEKDATVVSDPIKLRQILVNLIGNALKFTSEGSVSISARRAGRGIEFIVSDTGPGIRKEDIGIIFDRFRQTYHDDTLVSRGTGLGLSISRGYAILLGGTLQVKSKFGEGSSFMLKIPHIVGRFDQSVNKTQEMEKSKVDIPDWSGKTILLAEDEPVNVMYMKIALKKTNVNILVAGTGQEAIDLYSGKDKVDVILMDIKMPVLDGFEAAKRLNELGCTAPIVALSGHAMIERERIRDAGFAELISKPVRKDDLITALRKWLD